MHPSNPHRKKRKKKIMEEQGLKFFDGYFQKKIITIII